MVPGRVLDAPGFNGGIDSGRSLAVWKCILRARVRRESTQNEAEACGRGAWLMSCNATNRREEKPMNLPAVLPLGRLLFNVKALRNPNSHDEKGILIRSGGDPN